MAPKTSSQKIQPKRNVRKTAEERERIAREEEQRRRARADVPTPNRGFLGSSIRGRGRGDSSRGRGQIGFFGGAAGTGRGNGDSTRLAPGGRGGFIGQTPGTRPRADDSSAPTRERTSATAETSQANINKDGKKSPTRSRKQKPAGSASEKPANSHREDEFEGAPDFETSHRATSKVKTELDEQDEPPSSPKMKVEGDRPKEAIDVQSLGRIDLTQDSDSEIQEDDEGDKVMRSSSRINRRGGLRSQLLLAPIAPRREEHRDRVVGINTEASSTTSAKVRKQQAEGIGGAEHGAVDAILAVEGIRAGRPQSKRFVGVYEEDDKTFRPKNEGLALDDSITGGPADTMGQPLDVGSSSSGDHESGNSDAAQSGPEAKASVQRKIRRRTRNKTSMKQHDSRSVPAHLQTGEEQREWDTIQRKMSNMLTELGTRADGTDEGSEARNNAIYVFQISAGVPDLYDKTSNEQGDNEPNTETMVVDDNKTYITETTASTQPLKPTEEKGGEARVPRLGSGKIGKLHVHKSGATSMDWGGVSLRVDLGVNASFYQSVVLLRELGEPADEHEEQYKHIGDAVSFGSIRGKFVAELDPTSVSVS